MKPSCFIWLTLVQESPRQQAEEDGMQHGWKYLFCPCPHWHFAQLPRASPYWAEICLSGTSSLESSFCLLESLRARLLCLSHDSPHRLVMPVGGAVSSALLTSF